VSEPVLPPLRDVVAALGLTARKGLGQHFLFDGNLTARIVREAGPVASGTTIEIGPGPGGLTRALLAAGATVVAVEKDRRCADALAQLAEAYPGRLTLVEGDAMEVDVAELGTPPRRIVANLPYNVATALLIGWLDRLDRFESLTLMFQKEVADRLAAAPGTAAYGRLAVIVQWQAEVHRLFDIPARAFVPPPKVVSSVVRIVPRARPLAPAARQVLERVTAAAFGQRRKMLRQSLRPLGGEELVRTAGLDPTARAETLSVQDFCALARVVADRSAERAG